LGRQGGLQADTAFAGLEMEGLVHDHALCTQSVRPDCDRVIWSWISSPNQEMPHTSRIPEAPENFSHRLTCTQQNFTVVLFEKARLLAS
jgi:hypothetical protein